MILSLQELELRPVRYEVSLPAGEIEFDNQVSQTSPLQAKGVAELIDLRSGEIRVRGTLTVTMEASCDRCLEPARIPLQRDFNLSYFPAEEFSAGGEDALDENASEIAYYQGDRLDLNEILREIVLLSLPMQLVCSETCRGICPTCGQNRNAQECDCAASAVDDRWSKLKIFRAELSPGH